MVLWWPVKRAVVEGEAQTNGGSFGGAAHIAKANVENLQLHQSLAALSWCNHFWSAAPQSIHVKFICTCFIYKQESSHYTLCPWPQWLPVSFIIDFKILLLVCKSLNRSVPEDVWCAFKIQHVPPRSLRSSGCLLAVPWAKTLIHGNAAFSKYGPCLWNSLLEALRTWESTF